MRLSTACPSLKRYIIFFHHFTSQPHYIPLISFIVTFAERQAQSRTLSTDAAVGITNVPLAAGTGWSVWPETAKVSLPVIPGLDLQQLHIASLAPTPDDHNKPPSQTATLQIYDRVPASLVFDANGECTFQIPGQRHPLIFDTHFLGTTPLNEVDSGEHAFEYCSPFAIYEPF